MAENKSIISTQTLQAVVDYLQTRPYQEVSKLINDVVSGTEPYAEPEPAPPEPSKKDTK